MKSIGWQTAGYRCYWKRCRNGKRLSTSNTFVRPQKLLFWCCEWSRKMFIAHFDSKSLCCEGWDARVGSSNLYLDLSQWRCVKTRTLVFYLTSVSGLIEFRITFWNCEHDCFDGDLPAARPLNAQRMWTECLSSGCQCLPAHRSVHSVHRVRM